MTTTAKATRRTMHRSLLVVLATACATNREPDQDTAGGGKGDSASSAAALVAEGFVRISSDLYDVVREAAGVSMVCIAHNAPQEPPICYYVSVPSSDTKVYADRYEHPDGRITYLV